MLYEHFLKYLTSAKKYFLPKGTLKPIFHTTMTYQHNLK